jgi:hypothetical protein
MLLLLQEKEVLLGIENPTAPFTLHDSSVQTLCLPSKTMDGKSTFGHTACTKKYLYRKKAMMLLLTSNSN